MVASIRKAKSWDKVKGFKTIKMSFSWENANRDTTDDEKAFVKKAAQLAVREAIADGTYSTELQSIIDNHWGRQASDLVVELSSDDLLVHTYFNQLTAVIRKAAIKYTMVPVQARNNNGVITVSFLVGSSRQERKIIMEYLAKPTVEKFIQGKAEEIEERYGK